MSRLPSRRLLEKVNTLLSKEKGTVKKLWNGKTTVVLVYPNRYYIGMSNLGFQCVYQLLNKLPDTLCERVFLPEREEQWELIRSRKILFSLESYHPLPDFHLIAFSLSFENDYPNILTILKLAKIPLLSTERGDEYPLIIAGGICIFLNPEPLADFIDLFIVGEAEEILPELISTYKDYRDKPITKEALLTHLAQIEGVYVPRFYQVNYGSSGKIESFKPRRKVPSKIKRKTTKYLEHFPIYSSIVTPHTEFGNMFLMEVNRGCSHRCRFCAIGCVYQPYRKRRLEELRATATIGLKQHLKIGLIGATLSDHPQITSLCNFIIQERGKFSATSMRIDLVDEELINLLKKSGHQTITLAPETGSERLRRVINKHLSDEQILNALEMITHHRFRYLKLYFLIGLPTEKAEDIEQLIELTKRIKHHLTKSLPRSRYPETITLSINPFIPKPSTPFQWHPLEHITILKDKLKKIQKSLKKEKKIVVTWDLPKWSYLQCLLSRGDRRVGKILIAAHNLGGNWLQAYKQVDINPDFYTYRQRALDETFPWDFIDHGVSKQSLVSEYKKALIIN
ncbi:MAG: hypothetical protein AMJ42_06580 [Deltaproteobacteria bacterium DG_8]|nr:MAG: hypothetical protein AMJ42_06580 [Deltaproteobacteria bacterium DG_8]